MKKTAVILLISIVSFLLFVAMVLIFLCYTRKGEIEDDPTILFDRVFFQMLYKATDGFSTKNLIGEGSFSSVYRGYLGIDGTLVAIKVVNVHREGGLESFTSECEALRNTRHRNIIRVLTCCDGIDFQGNEFKGIVYEFMPNGSLEKWLYNVENELPPLTLLQRVCIALDVAHALNYLHHHAGHTIIHCDLKPSNILLDEDMVAHVGDFGLSEIIELGYQNRQLSSSARVRGTVGYVPPEYGLGSEASRSADTYSYGILLLEMITTKKPTDAMFEDGFSLHKYAKIAMSYGALEIVDPVIVKAEDGNLSIRTSKEGIKEIEGYMSREAYLSLLLEIGVSCSEESPLHRMDTDTVIEELQLIKDAILGNSTVFLSSKSTGQIVYTNIVEQPPLPKSSSLQIIGSVPKLPEDSIITEISRYEGKGKKKALSKVKLKELVKMEMEEKRYGSVNQELIKSSAFEASMTVEAYSILAVGAASDLLKWRSSTSGTKSLKDGCDISTYNGADDLVVENVQDDGSV